jgi:hypothetical protein
VKAVEMMGGAPGLLPLPRPEAGVERWGLNNLYMSQGLRQRFLGWTRWFDLHSNEHIVAGTNSRRKYPAYDWLCVQQRPVYRWVMDPRMKHCRLYPHREVRGAFDQTRLFCSTLDWMLALAVYEQFTHIDLYGWRMAHPGYTHQVYSGQWWILRAQQAGVVVRIFGASKLKTVADRPLPRITIPAGCLMYGLETTDRSKLYHAR